MPDHPPTSHPVEPPPQGSVSDPILVVDAVRKSFGGLIAVDVDHLEIERGVITGLIGPNGAGKTTLFNVLTGFERSDHGQWSLDGRPIERSLPHRIASRGMVRTFQLTKALRKMTVLDNMKLAATDQRGERLVESMFRWRWKAQEAEIESRALALLDRFELLRMKDEYAGTLSGGQRKLLEIARALMVQPSLVMLDEPMAGVNPALVDSLIQHIQRLPEEGTTVLFIEHDMDVVMNISDRVVCMSQGAIIAEGRPRDVRQNPAVIDAYLGTRHGPSGTAGGAPA